MFYCLYNISVQLENMHFLRALQLLLPVASVYAQLDIDFTCFDGGTTTSCESFVSTFCETVSDLSFSGGDTGSRCFNVAGGVRCDFTASNFATTVGTPTESRCEDTLSTIMDECTTGGLGNVVGGTFSFAVKPNTGACPNTV